MVKYLIRTEAKQIIMGARPHVSFGHYGIAPFEVEALYSILNGVFAVKETRAERPENNDYACMIEINFPLEFNEDFFETVGRKRWERITFLIKEMRRRTGKKGVRLVMNFAGKPSITFTIAMRDKNLFEFALERLEILSELIALQTDSDRLPDDVNMVNYEFDVDSTKWTPKVALGDGTEYMYHKGEWIS
jgi:hypothetical protein